MLQVGMLNPRLRSVCSSAKKVSEAPACSKALQKKTTKKETMKMTAILFFSSNERDLSEKTTNPINARAPMSR